MTQQHETATGRWRVIIETHCYRIIDPQGMEVGRYADADHLSAEMCFLVAERRRLENEVTKLAYHEVAYAHALECVNRVFQEHGGQEAPPLLPDFCRIGDDKFEAVVKLAQLYIRHMEHLERWTRIATMGLMTAAESKAVGWDCPIIPNYPTPKEVDGADRERLAWWHRFLRVAINNEERATIKRIMDRLVDTYPKD